jgi:hypothetical protein
MGRSPLVPSMEAVPQDWSYAIGGSPHDDDALDRDGEPYFVALTENGTCSMYPDAVREGVTVWTDRKRLEKTRAHYRSIPETPLVSL